MGRATRVAYADGRHVENVYDASGRPAVVRTGEQSTDIDYEDASSQAASVARGNERVDFEYDGSLQLGLETSGRVPSSATYAYDDSLQLDRATVNGSVVAFARDADGLLTDVGDLALQRDAETGGETGSQIDVVSTARTDSEYGETDALSARVSDTTIFEQSIDRGDDGTIDTLRETTGGETRELEIERDVLGRISSATDGETTRTFDYDADGNRIRETSGDAVTTATFNDAGQLTARAGTTYAYDGADASRCARAPGARRSS